MLKFDLNKLSRLRMRQKFPHNIFISIKMAEFDKYSNLQNHAPLFTKSINLTPYLHKIKNSQNKKECNLNLCKIHDAQGKIQIPLNKILD